MPFKYIYSNMFNSLRSMQLLIILLVLTISCTSTAIAADSDYSESDSTQYSSENGSDFDTNNDEIYDPVLRQDVEETNRKNHIAELDMMSEKESSTNRSFETNQTNINENISYDNDMVATALNNVGIPIDTGIGTLFKTNNTRKSKSDTFTHKYSEEDNGTHGNDVSLSSSVSDYIDDNSENGRTSNKTTQNNINESKVPFAMKLYHDKQLESAIAVNNLHDNDMHNTEHHYLHHNHHQSNEDYYNEPDEETSTASSERSEYFVTTSSAMQDYIAQTTFGPKISIPQTTQGAQLLNIPNTLGYHPATDSPEDALTSVTTTSVPTLSELEPLLSVQSRTFLFGPATGSAEERSRTTLSSLTSDSATTTKVPSTFTSTVTSPSPPTSSTSTTSTTITNRPTGKQGKQIKISRRKLLPHEQLRNYIEDAYIRMPLAVIVDPSAESLEKTKTLWRDALRMNLNIKIVLVSLNASGIPAAYNFNNTRQFLAGLNSIREHDGGNAFIGVVHASELVPYDSAVFISTAAIPSQIDLVQDAAITLLKKRIRLYVIWYGDRAISENETQEAVGGILGEVAIRSGGEILHIVGSESSQELEGTSTLTLVADAFLGSQEIDIPVDTTLSSLHVKIDAPMQSAILETPNGDINLRKLVKFKSKVFTMTSDDKRLDSYVPLTKLRKSTTYKLRMIPEYPKYEYSVFVRAERKADLFLDDMIRRFDTYFVEGNGYYPAKYRNDRIQSITAALAAVSMPTHDNLKFPNDELIEFDSRNDSDVSPKTEVETFSDIEIHKSISNNTTTMAISNQRSNFDLQRGTTSIVMGTNSQILVATGMMAQLYFEITNTRSSPIFHNIQVTDERRFLLRLTPQSIFIRPGETVTVTVTVLIPSGTPQGTTDRITFTCHGEESTSLSLNLRVITATDSQDTTAPSIHWSFGNRCGNVAADASNCAENLWTLDITAQDWETGVLRLQSTPSGLIYRNAYVVGSRDPLKATYIATCCEPKVSLIAFDIAGNQRSYNIDVRNFVFTDAIIAAIVLGVLLLILLIVLLIVGIVWCCRRRKVTLDLPTYRSHSTRSMD